MPITVATVLKRMLLGAAAGLVLAYGIDFLSVRWRARHATAIDPYETLTGPRADSHVGGNCAVYPRFAKRFQLQHE